MAKKFNFGPSDTKKKAEKGKEKASKRAGTFIEKLGQHLAKK